MSALIEPGLERAIETGEDKPVFAGDGFDSVLRLGADESTTVYLLRQFPSTLTWTSSVAKNAAS